MKKSLLRLLMPLVLLGAWGGLPGGVEGHEGATGIVKERMDHMKALAASMKALAAFVQGDVAFDGEEVVRLANDISSHTGQDLVKLFPQGSVDDVTTARPEIWQRWDQFERLADEAEAQAKTMVQSASGNPSLLSPQQGEGGGASALGGPDVMAGGSVPMPVEMAVSMNFMHLANTCKNCHIEFRQKKTGSQ